MRVWLLLQTAVRTCARWASTSARTSQTVPCTPSQTAAWRASVGGGMQWKTGSRTLTLASAPPWRPQRCRPSATRSRHCTPALRGTLSSSVVASASRQSTAPAPSTHTVLGERWWPTMRTRHVGGFALMVLVNGALAWWWWRPPGVEEAPCVHKLETWCNKTLLW